jgi:hypothetical protein
MIREEGQAQKEIRTFRTMTSDLSVLHDWLLAHRVTHIAMESTGVYWKPVFNRFPTHRHLGSWAGLCPGNNESAGKRKSGKTRKGDRWLKRGLMESSWAIGRTNGTYLSALYQRMARRRGKKKAVVAVAHTMLVTIYHMLKYELPYRELGAEYFDRLNVTYIKTHFVRRVEGLGYKVTLEPLQLAA